MAYVTTRGVSLRCIDYSETSQVVMLITPDRGQVHVLAKGSRKPGKDPKKCAWDVLMHYDCVLSQKAAGNLHLAVEWAPKERFPALAGEMRRFWFGFYAAEVVAACTSETPEDGGACDCLCHLLRDLQSDRPAEVSLFAFLTRFLQLAGCAPVTDGCAQCNCALHGRTGFSPHAGGALCGDCATTDPYAFAVSRGALAVLRALANGKQDTAQLRVTKAQIEEIQRAFNEQIQYHLGRPLRTARFLRSFMDLRRSDVN